MQEAAALRRSDVREWDRAAVEAIIRARASEPGALLPILHDLQHAFGYVDREALPLIADALNLSRAEVHGVVSFYHDFRAEPAGRTVVKLCRAEACQSMGARGLVDHLASHHGLSLGDTSPDGAVTVEEVFCLGNCALAPAAMVDGDLVGRVTPATLDTVIADARKAKLS